MYNSWTFEKEDDRKKPAVIFEKFENQLEPKTSHRIHGYTLKCQFRDNAEVEDRVLDQLIWGLLKYKKKLIWGSKNPGVQKALITRDKTLTLAAAIEIARSHEATNKHMRALTEQSTSYQESKNIESIQKEQERGFCNNCGKQHPPHPRNKCPANGYSPIYH